MRLLKFFPLVATVSLLATYVTADEASQVEPTMQQEDVAFNQEPAISYHSSADERADTTEQLPAYDQGYELQEEQMMSGYNSPARFDVKGGWDVFVTASYLYWEAKEKGLDYAITIPADAAVLAPVDYNYKVHSLDFDYKSGFKVALGTNLNHDNWTLMLEYARLTGTHNSSTTRSTDVYTSTPERLLSPWIYSTLETGTVFFTHLTGKWESKYNMFNLELARPCYVGTNLIFKPHMGLTTGWIDQEYTAVGTIVNNATTITSKAKSDSWIAGPRAGVDGHWLLGAGFDVEADVAGALVYQDFDVSFKQASNSWTTAYVYNSSKDVYQITPVLEGTIGLGWGTYLDSNNWQLSFQALYDFLYYFNQNQMRKLTDQVLGMAASTTRINSKADDLWLHGLTVTARLDF